MIRRFSATLLLLVALTVSTAEAAPVARGCGFRLAPGARAVWYSFGAPTNPPTVVLMDLMAIPWGPTGAEDRAAYLRRYAGGDPELPRRGGMTLQGESNERAWQTSAVLAAACLDGQWGPGWDCVPTRQEVEDYAAVVRRGTGLYARYAALFRGPVTPPTPSPNLPPPAPPEPSPAPGPAPCLTCPAPPACAPCAEVPVLLPVPARIRETAAIMVGWRTIGAGREARLRQFRDWLVGVLGYRPALESTGRTEAVLVPQ